MNETSFNFTYFFETLIGRILYVAMNLPSIYTTLLTVFILLLLQLENTLIGFAALGVGVVLKLVFTLSMKNKNLKTEVFTIGVDVAGGLLVVLFAGYVFEFVVIGLTVLYLIYYSYVMTISYTRLGHTTAEILHDLQHRHERQNKKAKKQK